MSGDKSQLNGDKADENEDVVMEEEDSKMTKPGKSGKDKDGDDEMTVLVPPSKGKSDGPTINGATDGKAEEEEVDPREKASSGKKTSMR